MALEIDWNSFESRATLSFFIGIVVAVDWWCIIGDFRYADRVCQQQVTPHINCFRDEEVG